MPSEYTALDGRSPPGDTFGDYASALIAVPFLASTGMLCTSIIVLGYTYNISSVCTGVLLWPLVAVALFLMVIYVVGIIGMRLVDSAWPMVLFFVGLLVAMVAILAIVIFGYIAVGGIDLSPVKVREYNLTDYRGWLRGRVADPQYWSKISACLHDKHACDAMTQLVRDPETGTFVPKKSWAKDHELGDGPMPIESGRCKPPSSCGFTYVNGTWIPTPGAPVMETDVDCRRWSNEQQTLCFQCGSCKAGLLQETLKGWSMASIYPIVVLIGFSCLCYGCLKRLED